MLALAQVWVGVASAWTAGELRPAPPLPPTTAAAVGTFDGAPAFVVLGPGGLSVVDPDGEVVVASEALTGAALLVRDLDGRGSDEVLVCGPDGIRLLRGDRAGLFEPRVLAEAPCDGIAADDEGLVTTNGPETTRWVPAVTGLEPHAMASRPAELTSKPWVPVAGQGSGAPPLWLLDSAGWAVGVQDGDEVAWHQVPVPPVIGLPWDSDEDGCVDLLVYDAEGAGAIVAGLCEAAVPEPASELVIRDLWGTLDVHVGQALDVQLVDADGRTVSWHSRGGPPGFVVQQTGRIAWAPEADDVGQWRVSVRLSGRWNGFLLRVLPSEGASLQPGPASADVAPRGTVRIYALRPRRCAIGLGLAGGAATAGEVTWENLGGPEVRGGASPMAAMTCAGGSDGPVQWVVGADTAPFFSFAGSPRDRTHALGFVAGLQVGPERLHAGPYATAGFDVLGIGVRAEWLGLRDWREHPMGLEARLLWIAPQLGAEAAVAWVWTL